MLDLRTTILRIAGSRNPGPASSEEPPSIDGSPNSFDREVDQSRDRGVRIGADADLAVVGDFPGA